MKIEKDYNIVAILVFLGVFFIPAYAIFMFLLHPEAKMRLAFLIFTLFITFERLWENFFTSKDKKRSRLYGDWTYPLVSIGYLFLAIVIISDFYINNTYNSPALSLAGFVLLSFSIYVRFLSMRVLGKQWSIHAHGVQKIRHIRLIKIGPYKYVRHPIYSSVFIEVISFSFIANSFFGFFCAIFINIPLQILRAYKEEQTSIRRFGNEYIKYKKQIPAFIPYKLGKL